METADRGVGLAAQAYATLKHAIITHELPPGTRLSVPMLAERLGVSRSPAREAIARITHEGLAHFEPNRGAVVANVDSTSLAEIYEIREVLEGLAARLAATQITDTEIAELRSLIAEHAAAVEAGDVEQHYELDVRFHRRIHEIAGNATLTGQLERLQQQVRLAMYTTHRSPGGMPQALAEHRRIVDSLESRDSALAEAAGRSHISRLLRDLVAAQAAEAREQPEISEQGA
ncbi:GntR family transcriptional regulator [Haloactinopolyspora sp.]|uniref:GntR family transcriptional regulator n=1 Tax=Haloactinopolyspora sp. TaxID=1966353 RepID=UPI002629E5C0|nr:GntR family transcriptional regulator [Haloactinopolyspora sp.]